MHSRFKANLGSNSHLVPHINPLFGYIERGRCNRRGPLGHCSIIGRGHRSSRGLGLFRTARDGEFPRSARRDLGAFFDQWFFRSESEWTAYSALRVMYSAPPPRRSCISYLIREGLIYLMRLQKWSSYLRSCHV